MHNEGTGRASCIQDSDLMENKHLFIILMTNLYFLFIVQIPHIVISGQVSARAIIANFGYKS